MPGIIDNATILIVDDTPQNIDILVEALHDSYTLLVAINGQDALDVCDKNIPDLILLDIMMPEMDGFEVCTILKGKAETLHIPIIFLTAATEIDKKTKGFDLGAVDYITKPFDIREVKARIETHLTNKYASDFLKDQNKMLDSLVQKRTRQIENTQDVTIRMAASLAETRDNETGAHILRTQHYVGVLAKELAALSQFKEELTEENIRLLIKSAPLHDIGKIGVADAILLKPGKLTDEEFDEMKNHTVYGNESLLRAEEEMEGESFLRYAREIAYSHHEKWNGFGYPEKLKGEDIPLSGRIMALADVYDALISRRVYKSPFTHTKAVSIIEEGKGSHFDPVLTDCFLKIQESFRQIALKYVEHEEEREALRK